MSVRSYRKRTLPTMHAKSFGVLLMELVRGLLLAVALLGGTLLVLVYAMILLRALGV
jgi:hypothetical protein